MLEEILNSYDEDKEKINILIGKYLIPAKLAEELHKENNQQYAKEIVLEIHEDREVKRDEWFERRKAEGRGIEENPEKNISEKSEIV